MKLCENFPWPEPRENQYSVLSKHLMNIERNANNCSTYLSIIHFLVNLLNALCRTEINARQRLQLRLFQKSCIRIRKIEDGPVVESQARDARRIAKIVTSAVISEVGLDATFHWSRWTAACFSPENYNNYTPSIHS